jgi:hypothetical protein
MVSSKIKNYFFKIAILGSGQGKRRENQLQGRV